MDFETYKNRIELLDDQIEAAEELAKNLRAERDILIELCGMQNPETRTKFKLFGWQTGKALRFPREPKQRT